MLHRSVSLGLVVIATAVGLAQAQTVLHVDDDASAGGDGQTWTTAYKYLQDALAVAQAGEEIHVGQGTYKPDQDEGGHLTPGDREATFHLHNALAIRGGYRGLAGGGDADDRDIEAFESTLSGDLADDDGPDPFENNGENSYHVVTGSSTDETAVLDGVTIRGGAATGSGPGVHSRGGGMYNSGHSNPTLMNCTFNGNAANLYGGGMYNGDHSDLRLINCTFSGNLTRLGGAGMYNVGHSSSTLINCTFSGNSSIDYSGGGLQNHNSDPTLINCTFSGNTADHDSAGYGGYGGALYNTGNASPTLTNCTFSGNWAYRYGGAIYNFHYSNPTLTNCTFAGNSAVKGRALYCDSYQQQHPSDVKMANSILWDGGNEVWNNDGSTIMITYSDVQGGWPGDGNINADPLFVDPPGGDLHLAAGSPCIDAADNTTVPPDVADLDGDGDTTERTPLDLEGNSRFVDDPDTEDTGVSDPPNYMEIVDMGVYEFFPDCNTNGVADELEPDGDGDGLIDECDACPDSHLNETIVIDGCDTGVANMMLGDGGCTMADEIAGCAEGVTRHGEFVSCVARLTNEWRRDGLISGRERGRIRQCAAQAEIP